MREPEKRTQGLSSATTARQLPPFVTLAPAPWSTTNVNLGGGTLIICHTRSTTAGRRTPSSLGCSHRCLRRGTSLGSTRRRLIRANSLEISSCPYNAAAAVPSRGCCHRRISGAARAPQAGEGPPGDNGGGGSGGSGACRPFRPHWRDNNSSATCADDRGFNTSNRTGGEAWAVAVAVAEAAKVLMFSRKKSC